MINRETLQYGRETLSLEDVVVDVVRDVVDRIGYVWTALVMFNVENL